MDGTLINAIVLKATINAYRNQHGTVAQDILCVYDLYMKFTFVYTGWEGTTHDSRILLEALRSLENNFSWPEDDNICTSKLD